MSLYDEKKKNDQLILEHGLYEKAVVELETDLLDKGSWGKALVEANGDEVIARGLYIKHRVQILKDHIEADKIRKITIREEAEDFEKLKAEVQKVSLVRDMVIAKANAEARNLLQTDVSMAIQKLKQAKGVRLAQDLVGILGIVKIEKEGETLFSLAEGSAKHKTLQGALVEYIEKNGLQ